MFSGSRESEHHSFLWLPHNVMHALRVTQHKASLKWKGLLAQRWWLCLVFRFLALYRIWALSSLCRDCLGLQEWACYIWCSLQMKRSIKSMKRFVNSWNNSTFLRCSWVSWRSPFVTSTPDFYGFLRFLSLGWISSVFPVIEFKSTKMWKIFLI